MEYNLFEKNVLTQWDGNVIIISNVDYNSCENNICVSEKFMEMYEKIGGNITYKDRKVIIKNGKISYKENEKIYNKPQTEFEFNNNLTINSDVLKIAQDFVCKSKSGRAVLYGVYIQENGKVCATDGISLFCNDFDLPYEENGIILPASIINYLDGQVKIEYNEKACKIECNNKIYITRLIVGKYPNIDQLKRGLNNDIIEFDYKEINYHVNMLKDKEDVITVEQNKFKINDTYEAEFDNKNCDFKVTRERLAKVLKYIDDVKVINSQNLMLINNKFIILKIN